MQITNRLTLRPENRAGDGPDMRNWNDVYQYSVGGLPAGQEALIARMRPHCWQILRLRNGVQGHWTGEYASAEEALSALEKELGRPN